MIKPAVIGNVIGAGVYYKSGLFKLSVVDIIGIGFHVLYTLYVHALLQLLSLAQPLAPALYIYYLDYGHTCSAQDCAEI